MERQGNEIHHQDAEDHHHHHTNLDTLQLREPQTAVSDQNQASSIATVSRNANVNAKSTTGIARVTRAKKRQSQSALGAEPSSEADATSESHKPSTSKSAAPRAPRRSARVSLGGPSTEIEQLGSSSSAGSKGKKTAVAGVSTEREPEPSGGTEK
jgi:hypothetical protein